MKKQILFLATIALATTSISAQNDWQNHARYAAENAALTKAPDVVFMGNSITDCWDDSHPEFFTDNNFANRGISGQVTTQMLGRFYADVIALKPHTVVILGGTNDIAQNQGYIDLPYIAQNVISMAELARQNGIRPIIASNLPCASIPWNANLGPVADKVVAVNKMIRDYAESHGITYVDYYSALTTPEGALDPKYTNDGVHPTQVGYDIMEPMILEAINAKCCKEEKSCCKKGSKSCAKKDDIVVVGSSSAKAPTQPDAPVYIVDGKVVGNINDVDQNKVASVNILNPETVKNGAVIITLKK